MNSTKQALNKSHVVRSNGGFDVEGESRSCKREPLELALHAFSPNSEQLRCPQTVRLPPPPPTALEGVLFVTVGSALAEAPLGAVVVTAPVPTVVLGGSILGAGTPGQGLRQAVGCSSKEGNRERGLEASTSGSQKVSDTPRPTLRNTNRRATNRKAGKPHTLGSTTSRALWKDTLRHEPALGRAAALGRALSLAWAPVFDWPPSSGLDRAPILKQQYAVPGMRDARIKTNKRCTTAVERRPKGKNGL